MTRTKSADRKWALVTSPAMGPIAQANELCLSNSKSFIFSLATSIALQGMLYRKRPLQSRHVISSLSNPRPNHRLIQVRMIPFVRAHTNMKDKLLLNTFLFDMSCSTTAANP